MRQAGRYLPEYRELRTQAPTFLDFCYTPKLAIEATLQPIRRFGFDAAILFSDILVMPDALGQSVSFEAGEGPRLSPIENEADFAKLRETPDWTRLAPVFEAVASLSAALAARNRADRLLRRALDGGELHDRRARHAGSGAGAAVRLSPSRIVFGTLIDRLADASADYLARQVEAGAEAVQVFDSWSGVLPTAEFERWCVAPLRRLVARLHAQKPGVPVIAFPRCAATHLGRFAEIEGLVGDRARHGRRPAHRRRDAAGAAGAAGQSRPAGADRRRRGARRGGGRGAGRASRARAHIFNLGHGILPETPIAHVERMLARLRG